MNISQEELSSFHGSHFGPDSIEHFSQNFLGPVEEQRDEYYQEDGELGYYEDGVKRTLTDEQIAIFRHSEIESLLRDRRHIAEARASEDPESKEPSLARATTASEDIEDGELEEESTPTMIGPIAPPGKSSYNNKKKKRNKLRAPVEKGYFKQNVKPDLRKRTWDKVETGLDDLQYDDMDGTAAAPGQVSQRRKISYDD
ncbi:hypothetical protein BJ875DRAFT_165466 [Amylocarpus encephaloides]|uniref:Uncharacterized protein n=1 Tax=Amylocarpus encephaloides TaxID=45428 RepID=A0A9P7YBC9_9HELO|nr:hypothetical protein BJ875DRAFT_165466 [Amylocarpus encephaloides]